MKRGMVTLVLLALASPVYAQLGGLNGALKKAQQVQDKKQQIDDLVISEDEERTIGEDVSAKIRERFGVVQDPAVHRYVTLVGTALAQQSDRSRLAWTFIVLDTDGVNAFASPGGFVHITRGALGLVRNEAELAGVLSHEVGHVVRKHTVNAIQKNKLVAAGVTQAAGGRSELLSRMANQAYAMVLENSFDRGDELDADRVGVQLALKVGYAPALGDFLTRLDERNKDQAERNGLFASHPETAERIDEDSAGGGWRPDHRAGRAALQRGDQIRGGQHHLDRRGHGRGRRPGRRQQAAGEAGRKAGEERRAQEKRIRPRRLEADGRA